MKIRERSVKNLEFGEKSTLFKTSCFLALLWLRVSEYWASRSPNRKDLKTEQLAVHLELFGTTKLPVRGLRIRRFYLMKSLSLSSRSFLWQTWSFFGIALPESTLLYHETGWALFTEKLFKILLNSAPKMLFVCEILLKVLKRKVLTERFYNELFSFKLWILNFRI